MTTHTFYRKADVPKADAIAALLKRYPSADILKFIEKKASVDEARAARVKPGNKVFEAKIRVAEFPPSDDDSSESDSGEESSEPKSEPSEPKEDSDPKEDSGGAPDFGGGDEGGEDLGGEPKEMSHDEKVEHLLEQILDAVKGGGLGGPEEDLLGGGPDDAGLGLPDIGAPEQGEALPPPAGGPGGPGGAPLPPPAKPKGPGAPAAFAKFNPKLPKVTLVREGVDQGVKTRSLIAEAEELFGATHKVAKIRRTGSEKINGADVNLPERKLAVITLVRK